MSSALERRPRNHDRSRARAGSTSSCATQQPRLDDVEYDTTIRPWQFPSDPVGAGARARTDPGDRCRSQGEDPARHAPNRKHEVQTVPPARRTRAARPGSPAIDAIDRGTTDHPTARSKK